MRISYVFLGSFLQSVSAHYSFSYLMINGTQSSNWQYIRKIAGGCGWESCPPDAFNNNTTSFQSWPQEGVAVFDRNSTCGRKAWDFAPLPETATIVAGSEVVFSPFHDPADAAFHDGPMSIYLARVPSENFASFDASDADWFKIAYWGPKNDTHWWVSERPFWPTAIIPKKTPHGKYLLRVEHFWPLVNPKQTQYYVNCAHIDITGEGGATLPTATAKFPGLYKIDTPGFGVPSQSGLLEYNHPWPEVWSG